MDDQAFIKQLMDTFNTFAQQEVGNKLSIFAVSGLAENVLFLARNYIQASKPSVQSFEAEKPKE